MRRLPAEWEPHSAILLTWPHEGTDWARQLAATEDVYTQLCYQVSAAGEKLLIVCRDGTHRSQVERRLGQAGIHRESLVFALADSNDSWTRDHGPLICIEGSGLCIVDFRFNGWGGRFPAALDDRITPTLFQQGIFGDAHLLSSDLVLEGGAVETDGRGTLLATRASLLGATRNPGLTEAQVEGELGRTLGLQRFLWLDHGRISGDDTDGHIDTLARFCNPRCICHLCCRDRRHPDYHALKRMEEQLRGFRGVDGKPYDLVSLPSPRPRFDTDGRRLPASYANFLIANRSLLLPVYSDPADETACQTQRDLFPDRRVIPIDCSALIRQNGSLHCITMQIPDPVELKFTGDIPIS